MKPTDKELMNKVKDGRTLRGFTAEDAELLHSVLTYCEGGSREERIKAMDVKTGDRSVEAP